MFGRLVGALHHCLGLLSVAGQIAAMLRLRASRLLLGLARLSTAASGGSGARHLPAASPGIDCGCYFTDNFFVRSPIEGHFSFDGAEDFAAQHAPLLDSLSEPRRAELIANLEAEAARRFGQAGAAAARKRTVAAEYSPRHPELWTLDGWLHPDFVSLVRSILQLETVELGAMHHSKEAFHPY